MMLRMQESIRNDLENVQTPLCFINASKDDVVDNNVPCAIFNYAKNRQTELHEVEGADHVTVQYMEPYVRTNVQLTSKFFSKLL